MALFSLQPTLDDGPSCVPLSSALMQNQFKPMKDEPFLTFVIAFYPADDVPDRATPGIPRVGSPITLRRHSSGHLQGPYHSRKEAPPPVRTQSFRCRTTTSKMRSQSARTPPSPSCAAYPWVLGGAAEGLVYLSSGIQIDSTKKRNCRRYTYPGRHTMDAHALSRVHLREPLQDIGMALRSINMLQLAVIRFSSECRP
ncbi:hypothetical protein EDB87DRAFT_1332094 [Lactarius vividus]|nr:hypothetical protein EDB87DRAFT_1332094 [Lactarius vividus]